MDLVRFYKVKVFSMEFTQFEWVAMLKSSGICNLTNLHCLANECLTALKYLLRTEGITHTNFFFALFQNILTISFKFIPFYLP